MFTIPLIYLDFSTGQYHHKPALSIYRQLDRRFSGLSVFSLLVSLAVAAYYVYLMAYCLLYIVQILIGNVGFLGRTDPEVLSDAKSFFRKEILDFIDPNQGTSVFGELNIPLLISVFFSVGLCFIIVAKGIHTSSKVAFFTVISPYFLFIIMLIRLFFLKGSGSGVAVLFRVDFAALISPSMWRNAFDQNFFQNSLGWGLLLVFATFRTRNQSVLDSAVLFFYQNPDCEFPDWVAREYRRFWVSWPFFTHQWNPTDRITGRRK